MDISFSDYAQSELAGSINMDVDDIIISNAPPASQGQLEMRPSVLVLNNLLRRNSIGSGEWTHLVKQPDSFRCSITDHEQAGELYRAVWRYTEVGLSVMERRLSPVTRISIEVVLGAHQLVASRPAERDLIRAVLEVLMVDLRDTVSCNHLDAASLTCFILRTTRSTGCSQRYWFHWPALAVSNRELTAEWCAHHWASALQSHCARVVPRNTSSYVPMYGCTVTSEEPPMLLHWVADEQGGLHENTSQWFMENPQAANLCRVFHIGHDKLWPTQAALDEARVARLLPLLLSINPMGTRCLTFLSPRVGSMLMDDESKQRRGTIRRILENLGEHRRLRRTRSNEVGQHLYQMSTGADWAMRDWLQWVCNGDPRTTQESAELAFEWQSFAQRDLDMDPQSVLYEMVRQDNPTEVMERFLHNERSADHERRCAPDGMLFSVIGSATHHDLAQYIKHELQSVAVCTSMAGNGIWYIYNRTTHRWSFDPEGNEVLVACLRILYRLVDTLRTGMSDENAPRNPPNSKPSRSPFPVLANFPTDGYSDHDIQKAILVHLDGVIGDVRHMQAVVRYLGKLVMNRLFAEQLDVRHEHLVPFANGVLDLERLCLRKGKPADLLLRGPPYPWVDFPSTDADTEELERMLSQIFTDREVLSYFMEVGGTWLRRRNRFKHFYVFTGNTNGGKSLLFSLVKAAFASLCGLLPIQAITGKDSDASNHSDYLARTHGQALCVCNEPDSSTQMLMPEKVKVMTSDSDHLAVRHLYGSTRDMPIMWKLILLCNTPPMYTQLDDASVQRTQYIPCNSTFVGDGDAPANEELQYRQGRFPRRDIPPTRQRELSRRLMCMFFSAYCHHGMQNTTYALAPPRRIRLESDRHLQELSVFRMYLRVFLRPCGTVTASALSIRAHQALTQATQRILMLHETWLDLGNNRANFGWTREWSDFDAAARNPNVVGSPGWVRCQCVHLLRFVFQESGQRTELEGLRGSAARRDLWLPLVIPYVDAVFVADQFNRYRKQQRVYLNRNLTNSANTFTTPSEQGEQQQQAQNQSQKKSQCVSLGSRMRLDRTLVRNVMREVTSSDPDGDRFIGRVFLGPNNRMVSDNDTQTGMMLDRVLALACRNWYRRFRAPMAHASLVTRVMMQRCVQAIIRRSQYPKLVGLPAERIKTSFIPDDWEKMVNGNDGAVLSDEDSDEGEDVMYDLLPDMQTVLPVQTKGYCNPRRTRNMSEFRLSRCILFPCEDIPESIVSLPRPGTGAMKENPIDWSCPITTDEAESLIITENFWESVELKQAIEASRIVSFQPGYSGVGKFRACAKDSIRDCTEEEHDGSSSLAFYLGPDTRLCLGSSTTVSARPSL